MSTAKVSPEKVYSETKTIIGALASGDSIDANRSLASLLYFAARTRAMKEFHFVLTGGTYRRLFCGDPTLRLPQYDGQPFLDDETCDILKTTCGVSVLSPSADGGLIQLSHLITQGHCGIVWPLYAPTENHWIRPENLAFMRLSDHWHVKRLMNEASVLAWIELETTADRNRKRQLCKPHMILEMDHIADRATGEKYKRLLEPPTIAREEKPAYPLKIWENRGGLREFKEMTIALIAHDNMKPRMVDFAVDHDSELLKFERILTTGTTGRQVIDACPKLEKLIKRRYSGPKGGDIEIATAILTGGCDVVIFFIDTMQSHPHIDDIRVVFQACMTMKKVLMITNEMHAREFMSRVVRDGSGLPDFEEKTT